MKGIRIDAFGDPAEVRMTDVESPPAPIEGQVRLNVAGVGVGYFDGLMIRGDYQIRPELPFIPGSSLAGTVESVGDGVTRLAPGDRVAAFALNGALADQIVVPADSCAPLPPSIDLLSAANYFIAWATSLYGLREIGQVKPGETVLVLGAAGTTGTTAIECARALGARVIACSSTEAKREHCRAHGAELAIDYTSSDWREQVKQAAPRGVDVVYDPVGGELAEPALRLLAPGGRFLVVGFVGGIARVPLNLFLLKRCSIHGVNWGGSVMSDPGVVPPVIKTLAEWTLAGRIDPTPTRVFPLEQAGEAFAALFGRESLGSIVIQP